MLIDRARDADPSRFRQPFEAGRDVHTVPVEPVTLDWESGDFTLAEVVHSRRATDFVVSEKAYRLRLYTWSPPPLERSFAPSPSPE